MKSLWLGTLIIGFTLSCKSTGEFKGQSQSSLKESELCSQNTQNPYISAFLFTYQVQSWLLFKTISIARDTPIIAELFEHYIACSGDTLVLSKNYFNGLNIDYNWDKEGSEIDQILHSPKSYDLHCRQNLVSIKGYIAHPHLVTGEDTLGNFEAHIKNATIECVNGSVQISGTLIYRDTFDFDKANRPLPKELATTIGRVTIPGDGFIMYSEPIEGFVIR